MADPVRAAGKHPFEYVAPSPRQIEDITTVRGVLREAYECIVGVIPPSRERSLAITKLEEVSMWANKAIVFNQEET